MGTTVKPVFISRKVYDFLDSVQANKLDLYRRADFDFWTGSTYVSRARYGSQTIWDFATTQNFQPVLTVNNNITFNDATDARSLEILQIIKQQNRRLAIYWSGGIDSTVILASLIKNWQQNDLSMVDVVMTPSSYYENPMFYKKIIKKHNFNIIEKDDTSVSKFHTHVVTDGEPADKLWLVRNALNYATSLGYNQLKNSWQQEQTKLVDFFQCKFQTKSQCEQYFKLVANNILETGAPVDTVSDWFWWINFNWHWEGHQWHAYAMSQNKTPENLEIFKQRYHPWYNTKLYQQWSFSKEGKASKLFQSAVQYKWPAKVYINEVFDNRWFMNYKTKTGSPTRYASKSHRPGDIFPVAIFQDGTALTSDQPQEVKKFIRSCLLI